ncbi:MAG: DUF1365 domain-containing protein [Thermoleophilia bacterium]|nr:DUF1365 domain-containing protein [Thermoleophilia bacterium]
MSRPLASAVYEGRIRHRRFEPFERDFDYRVFMLYLDLAEVPDVTSIHPLWSTRRRSPARFRRADYLGPANLPLRDAVADLVESRTGNRPQGPIRMLTHLRYWGVCENPVTFYYCFDAAGEKLETVVAEVTNVPWGDRHAYVIDGGSGSGRLLSARTPKELHVSPLMSMDHEYDLRFARPAATLSVHMSSRRQGRTVFDATLNLSRTELSRPVLSRLMLRRPPMSLKVRVGIYFQAAITRARGARYHPRPGADGRRGGISGRDGSAPGPGAGKGELPDREKTAMLCPVAHGNPSRTAASQAAPPA